MAISIYIDALIHDKNLKYTNGSVCFASKPLIKSGANSLVASQ